jgi:penicillin-insensitive murein DD-endopeptidase
MRWGGSMRSSLPLPLLALVFVLAPLGAAHAGMGRELPKKFRESPYSLMSLSVGHPNEGWQVRAKRLKDTSSLKVRASSVKRSYGHPALVLMLRRSAADVAKAKPGSVMLVGDLSSENGGPLSGHRSHQSGRDADIAFYMTNSEGRPAWPGHFVAFDGEGKAKRGGSLRFDDRQNWLLVESWAGDQRAGLSHIFVSTPLRKRLLDYGRRHARRKDHYERAIKLLKQPEQGEPHDDHFHVRIACPARQSEVCRAESK